MMVELQAGTIVTLELLPAVDVSQLAQRGGVTGPFFRQLHTAGGAAELGRPQDGPRAELQTNMQKVQSSLRRDACVS